MSSTMLVIFGAGVFAGVFVLVLHYARKCFNTVAEQQQAERVASEYEKQIRQSPPGSEEQYGEREQGRALLLAELAELRNTIRNKRVGKACYLLVLVLVYAAVLYGTAEVERFRQEAERLDRRLEAELVGGNWRSAFEAPEVAPTIVPPTSTTGLWELPISRAVAAFLLVLWATHGFLLFSPLPPFGQPLAHENYDPKRVPGKIRDLNERLSRELNDLWSLVRAAPPSLRDSMRETLANGPVRSADQLGAALGNQHAEEPKSGPGPLPPELPETGDAVGTSMEGHFAPDGEPATPGTRAPSGEDFLS